MKYLFDDFILDSDGAELRKQGTEVPLEPRAYALLCLLIAARHRVLSKSEIIDGVWEGRFITDAALSTVVKTLRQAIGDSGAEQRYVRTIRGRGFRFVAEVETQTSGAAAQSVRVEPNTDEGRRVTPESASGKPSLMVLPFHLLGDQGLFAVVADAIPHELIQGLSRMRWLRVIARGTAFRFRGTELDLSAIGQQFDVRYFLTGSVEAYDTDGVLTIDLVKASDSSVLWSERFQTRIDGIHETRERVAAGVIAALEIYIPQSEARDAHLNVSEDLDAWAKYHLGLSYMFRFTEKSNALARMRFEEAIALDPRFARAHAGLSFTRFQDAFMKYTLDTSVAIGDARRFAERAVELDPLDPFCNLNMGRSFWLEKDIEGGLGWLDRSVSLSPNYAQGLYSKSFAEAMVGRHVQAFANASGAFNLSPLDPLLYAMHGVRAFALIEAGDYYEAAIWAEKGARAPGAHFLILMIAAVSNALKGDIATAQDWARRTRKMRPNAGIEQFQSAFPFVDPKIRRHLKEALKASGF